MQGSANTPNKSFRLLRLTSKVKTQKQNLSKHCKSNVRNLWFQGTLRDTWGTPGRDPKPLIPANLPSSW